MTEPRCCLRTTDFELSLQLSKRRLVQEGWAEVELKLTGLRPDEFTLQVTTTSYSPIQDWEQLSRRCESFQSKSGEWEFVDGDLACLISCSFDIDEDDGTDEHSDAHEVSLDVRLRSGEWSRRVYPGIESRIEAAVLIDFARQIKEFCNTLRSLDSVKN